MAVKFGTSGLRGLVTDLTDDVCGDYVRAFLRVCRHQGKLLVGRDLRPSSPRIAQAVMQAAHRQGIDTVDCGAVPTPALALAALAAAAPSIMVTGSHIPADRNGLKFYTADGEITKSDEAEIVARYLGRGHEGAVAQGHTTHDSTPLQSYIDRYLGYFPEQCLHGFRIGNYQHSTVSRDLLGAVLTGLGADVVELGRSDIFVPVDTEAIGLAMRKSLKRWAEEYSLDAVVSTDGDGDRPLVTDEYGTPIVGDVLGVITALRVGAEAVVTPVSSNTMIERLGVFPKVIRTKIGSPYVIAGMAKTGDLRTVGFEANGGFLLGFAAHDAGRTIPPLRTRDSFLSLLAPLVTAAERRIPLSRLVAELPARWTASDRIEGVPTEQSLDLVRLLSEDAQARAAFFASFGKETSIDVTDGLRVSLASGSIIHLRPSGNAPELRCYVEADSPKTAAALVDVTLTKARNALT